LLLVLWPATVQAADFGDRLCASLSRRVAAMPGSGPVFLRSYDAADGASTPTEPALATAAFIYDNALAAIALTACGDDKAARRIGDAIVLAAATDRAGPQGRLRNAYRAGAQPVPPPPNGWWDARQGLWLEDAYQTGTATGNVAWAALALLTLDAHGGGQGYRTAAAHLAAWVAAHGSGSGFSGGVMGDDARPIGWKSIEENVDAAAVFAWLAADEPTRWRAPAAEALRFVAAQWDEQAGHFGIGTLPDGKTPNKTMTTIDAQTLPLLLPGAAATWRRALRFAETAHGVGDGFDFNDDRDGIWIEGTSQAALAYAVAGETVQARRRLVVLEGQVSPGGLLWATSIPRLTTGLANGEGNGLAYYFRWPHLGATAWAILAAKTWNPFARER
jgi:hypothetical protein